MPRAAELVALKVALRANPKAVAAAEHEAGPPSAAECVRPLAMMCFQIASFDAGGFSVQHLGKWVRISQAVFATAWTGEEGGLPAVLQLQGLRHPNVVRLHGRAPAAADAQQWASPP